MLNKEQQKEVESVPKEGLYVNLQSQQVWLDGVLLELTAMEYALLTLFYSRPNTIFSRDQVMDHLRGQMLVFILAP